MACTIIYQNQTEVPVGVEDKNGNTSQLFQEILSNPHIQDFDNALEIYQNIYSQDFEQEPSLVYKSNGQNYNSYKTALENTYVGNVQAGIEINGKFIELFSINSDTNINSFNGLINNLLKSDLISGETIIDTDGKKLYLPVGNSTYKQQISSDSAYHTAKSSLGRRAVKKYADGTLSFNHDFIDNEAFINSGDNIEYIAPESINNKSYNQLQRNSSDAIGVMAARAYKESNKAFGNTPAIEEIEIVPENELQRRIKELLNNLGIKTVSLESYTTAYSKRNNTPPSAEALADISNQIIAFRNGEITQSDLVEETAHFIIEGTDPAQIENLLRNVHRTKEWADNYQAYSEVYDNNDNLIRKEILGKILANSLQNNFNTESQRSETEKNIVQRLLDVFNSFFDRINTFFKPLYQTQLEQYTKSVYDNLMAGDIQDVVQKGQFTEKKFTLYSLTTIPQEYKTLQQALNQLTNQQAQLSKKLSSPASRNMLKEAKAEIENAINNLETEIETTSRLKALTYIAELANQQLNYLNRVIDSNSNSGYHFAQEEEAVYQNFVNRLEPVLARINNKLSNRNPQEKAIKTKIDNALKKAAELKGKVPANNEAALNLIVNRVVQRNNMTPEAEATFREEIRKVLEAGIKDTSWFQAHLGQLNHAQNPILNLAGDVIARTMTESRMHFLQPTRQFLANLESIGFNPRELNRLNDGNGYILNAVDTAKLEDEDLTLYTDTYNSVSGKNISKADFNESLVDELPVDERNDYQRAINLAKRDRLESYFTPEYQEALNNASVEINGNTIVRNELPEIALEYEQNYRGSISQIRANNGGINTENDAYQIRELNKQRVRDSNPRNPDGTLKRGLQEIYDEQLEQFVVVIDEDAVNTLSDEDLNDIQRVYGLQMISLINRKFYEGQSARPDEIPQSFIDKLNEFETEQEKWDFVQLNSYIGFKREFWDNFGQNENLVQKLRNQKDGENDAEIDELISDIRGQQQIISNILRANREFNQPAETNVVEMADIEKASVKDASIQLEGLYNKARTFLPKEDANEVEEPYSETRANEAFNRDIEDEGITTAEERYNYILRHVTPANKAKIEKALKVGNKLKTNADTEIDRSLQGVINSEMSSSEIDSALMRYAESKLLPYYKRTQPVGYSTAYREFQQALNENAENAVENYITNNEYIDINPSYSFYNQGENINPKWIANRDAKRPQYTEEFLQKVRNNSYFERYGIQNEGDAPTRNIEEYQARQFLLEYQDATIENLNLTGRHDRYKLPQVHKNLIQRFTNNLSVSSVRESLKDMVNFRQDEDVIGRDEQGEATTSDVLLSIPTYGTRTIENKEDLSTDLLYSYTWMNQQSALNRARRENISDMYVLQDVLLNADYGAKKAEATNAYKMMKSFLNSAFYGQKETFSFVVNILGKEIDLGKVARVFNSWTRMVALGGLTIPITSALNSRVQRLVESTIGETTNPIALGVARKEYLKLAPAAMAEIGGLHSKAKLNILGENFGMYDLVNDRFENSIYNRGTRVALSWNGGLHAIGNFPVLPQTMLSVMMDYRYTPDGQLLSYNQYLQRNKSGVRKEVKEQWKKLPLYYDDIIVKDGQQTYNYESISQKTGLQGEELEQFIVKQNQAINNRVSSAIQEIDQQIREEDKSIAARDARANFFLNFLSFFLLGVQRLSKSRHYNISKDVYEEGRLVTLFELIGKSLRNPKQIKSAWKDALSDDVKKRNLKRAAVEMGVANALAIMAISLSNYVDDEEDVLYPIAFADYFLTRVTAEQISGTIALPRQVGQILDNPISAVDRVYGVFNILDAFSGEEVDRGVYAGETQGAKWRYQNLVLFKDYWRLSEPLKNRQTYEFFNSDVYNWTVLSDLLTTTDDEIEE